MTVVLILLYKNVAAQEYLGFSHSRFAGVLGLETNPSSILGHDLKSDWLFPVGLDVNFQTNLASATKTNRLGLRTFSDAILTQNDPKNGFTNLKFQINGPIPSFFIRLSKKHAIGFTYKIRSHTSINTSERLAGLTNDDIENAVSEPLTSLANDNTFSDLQFSITTMLWHEVNLSLIHI